MSSDSQSKGRVPFDPGWNDPPPLSYSPQMQTNKPRNILNKRVAFPLEASTISGDQVAPQPAFPPPTASVPMPISHLMGLHSISSPEPAVLALSNSTNVQPSSKEFNSEQASSEVSEILLGILEQGLNMDKVASDVRKRISLMEEGWRSGKLNPQAQMKMWKLALALKEDRPKEADELQKALAVEHAGAVGGWLPAIKRLVHYASARQDLLSIDKDDTS